MKIPGSQLRAGRNICRDWKKESPEPAGCETGAKQEQIMRNALENGRKTARIQFANPCMDHQREKV